MMPDIHRTTLRANRTGNIVYLNNPKVGCTTVKHNLWRALTGEDVDELRVHRIEGSPFTDDIAALDWLEGARIFTFVRNPFVRVVSGYLNKISVRDQTQWKAFARRHGLDPAVPLPFDDFVRLISEDAPEDLNPHWRPQYINLMYPFVQPNAIGKLERMDEELPGILARFLDVPPDPTPRRTPHATGASQSYRDYFRDPKTLRRVIDLFYPDFVHFRYSLDPEAPPEGRDLPPPPSDHGHPRLAALAALRAATTKAERQRQVKRLAELVETAEPGVRDDAFVRAWLLHARLEAGGVKKLAMVRKNLDTVLGGPEFLRRAAAELTAAQGAWSLCGRIAAVGARAERQDAPAGA